jgi:bifunctional non-homologous end joining protein LigD
VSLKTYQKKRSFKKTPEPRGYVFPTTQQRFVVQKHDATNLHYDLRLEHKGVMLSWAVPKGPSDNPADKHLAAQTEDHPLEYRQFEGVIPEGYGAGTVMVWDQGTFEWVRRGEGHMSFVLHGSKMRGEFVLVKLRRAGSKAWILFKKKDRYARRGAKLVNRLPNSVITGRTLKEIEAGQPAKVAFIKKLAGAKKAGLLRRVPVMKPTLVAKSFNDAEWWFESKWDGFRGIAYLDRGKVNLLSRNQLPLLDRFEPLRNIADAFAARRAVVDGEIGSFDAKGVSRFSLLHFGQLADLKYMVFDLLYLDGYDLRGVPLEIRKGLLRAILRPHPHVRFSDHIEGAGENFYRDSGRQGLEGVVAKERWSSYESGKRTHTWLKIKNRMQQEFVIGGWQEGQGARSGTIGSILVGVYHKKELVYSGRVGSGFGQKNLPLLLKILQKLETPKSPFASKVPRLAGVHFVAPRVVAEIAFAEWTSDDQLRQPVFLGIRTDKKPHEVVRERPRQLHVAKRLAATKTITSSHSKDLLNSPLALTDKPNQMVTLAGHDLKLTNLSKFFWTSPRITKRDVINYYYEIAPLLLPYLKDRPLTLKRYPEGASKWFFYQKEVPKPKPPFVETIKVQHSQGPTNYVLCNNVETLVWAANLADLEIHPWYSRKGSLNNPDFVVFDLDPTEEADLAGVREVALLIRDVLAHYKLVGYPKSSGSRGIHVYVPIKANVTYDQTKQFAKKLTEVVHHVAPKKTTLEFYKKKRHGVYIDYLQNIKGKTLANVYSLRARPYASVATPLTWHEVERGFEIKDFTIKNIRQRVRQYGDLYREVLTNKQDLRRALKTISKLKTD